MAGASQERLQIRAIGVVQGVGFRPFVYRLAGELSLSGWVRNDDDGVTCEVEGKRDQLLSFLERFQSEKPAASVIFALDHRFLTAQGSTEFEILQSQARGKPRVWILPDLATCDDCKSDVLEPSNRRHRYPFTNCTNCGPRFTIIDELPYDRPNTSMAEFVMCERCGAEYVDPENRRFHAQPNACAECGPSLRFVRSEEGAMAEGDEALELAVQSIVDGMILAVKGLGGYHIVVDARNEPAVRELRRRKGRPFKAFAIMYPDLASLEDHVELPGFARPFLTATQAPILILPRTAMGFREIALSVAPASPSLGVFLPYTPLHTLLLDGLGFPVVATSGNRSEQPTLHEDEIAVSNLDPLVDAFLLHDRPIRRQADDSVMHVITRPSPKPQMLRRARGYTPLPLIAPREVDGILALGGHMNVVFAVSRGRELILSQHLGDMDSFEAQQSYRRTLDDFLRLYELTPSRVVHDLHPDYFTSRLAEELGLPATAVQHHHAHLAACMFENGLEGEALGLCWDGTGLGDDGTIWGGEFLWGGAAGYQRKATLRPFGLPGGEKAIHETWRIALSLLWSTFGDDIPTDLPLFETIDATSIDGVLQMLRKGVNCPTTTSMGRLFDGVSALLGLSFVNHHQAQGPQLLEYAAWRQGPKATPLSLPIVARATEPGPLRLDWRGIVQDAADRRRLGSSTEEMAAGFHHALVEAGIHMIERLDRPRVVLAGGVFCNRYLTELFLERFEDEGIEGFVHSQLPPTDGSLAAGQLWVAANRDT